jgi:hypothetical protein
MDMKLRDNITQRAGVDLFGAGHALQRLAGQSHLLDQPRALWGGQVVKLGQAITGGDEDQPWKAAVVHQQDTAKLKLADKETVGGEAGIKGKIHPASLS